MDILEAFYETIKDIKMPKYYEKQAKKLKQPMGIIKSSSHLKTALLQSNYQQMGLLDRLPISISMVWPLCKIGRSSRNNLSQYPL